MALKIIIITSWSASNKVFSLQIGKYYSHFGTYCHDLTQNTVWGWKSICIQLKLMYSIKFSIEINISWNKHKGFIQQKCQSCFLVLHTIYMSTRLHCRQINFLLFWCSIFQSSSQKVFGLWSLTTVQHQK